jgi:hypothetical protein
MYIYKRSIENRDVESGKHLLLYIFVWIATYSTFFLKEKYIMLALKDITFFF